MTEEDRKRGSAAIGCVVILFGLLVVSVLVPLSIFAWRLALG